jgi:hypothetical protein
MQEQHIGTSPHPSAGAREQERQIRQEIQALATARAKAMGHRIGPWYSFNAVGQCAACTAPGCTGVVYILDTYHPAEGTLLTRTCPSCNPPTASRRHIDLLLGLCMHGCTPLSQ